MEENGEKKTIHIKDEFSRKQAVELIEKLPEGYYDITFTKHTGLRTSNQNNLYHLWAREIQKHFAEEYNKTPSLDAVKEHMKHKFITPSTANLTSSEMHEFLGKIYNFYSERGVKLTEPWSII